MKKRLLASLMSLCLIVGLLPTAAFAAEADTTEEAPQAVVCEVTPGCTLEAGHEGDCVVAPAEGDSSEPENNADAQPGGEDVSDPADPACTELAGCVDGSHDPECPLYVTPVEPDAEPEEVPAPAEPAEENVILDPAPVVENGEMSGNCGATEDDNVTWALTQNEDESTYTLTISGTGATADYKDPTSKDTQDDEKAPWYKALTANEETKLVPITAIVVEDGVTGLGDFAFAYTSIEKATFSENVTEYGQKLFAKCSELTTVDWDGYKPEKTSHEDIADVETEKFVSDAMFDGCTALKNSIVGGQTYENKLVLPKDIVGIGYSAFYDAEFETIDFLNDLQQVKYIGGYAFSQNESLSSLYISKDITYYLRKGSADTFSGATSLKSVTIENGVTSIPVRFFASSGIEELTIPHTVTEIGKGAFSGTKISSISLGPVTEIGNDAFANCSQLKTFEIEGSESLEFHFGKVFNEYGGSNVPLESFTLKSAASISKLSRISDTLKSLTIGGVDIPDGFFAEYSSGELVTNESLKTVTLLDGVTSIGKSAFASATSMTTLEIADSVTSIGNGAFNNCKNLTTVKISKDSQLETIEDFAFYWNGLKELYLPSKVSSIGNYAFQHNSNLAVVNMTDVTGTITYGNYAFAVQKNTNPSYTPVTRIYYVRSASIAETLTKSNAYSSSFSIIANTKGGTFAENTEFTSCTLATPIKDGGIFEGWYASSDFTGESVTSPKAGQTYYAKWIGMDDMNLQYGGSQKITVTGVELSGFQSDNASVATVDTDGTVTATGVGTATISATGTYNDQQKTFKATITVTPRVLTYSLTGGEVGSGSISYNFTEGHKALSEVMTFTWKDEPNTTVELTEGTDIDYTYTVSDSEGQGGGEALTYDYLPMPVGEYQNVKFNLLNENYTFGLTDGGTRDYLEITVNVVGETAQRAYLASAAPKADQTFTYDGTGKLPVEGVLQAYAQDSTASQVVEIGTFTVNIEGLNDTTFHSEVEDIQAGTNLAGISGLELPSRPGTYIITASASNESYYLYKSLVFSIGKATVTIRPDDKTAYVGDEIPALGENDYTVTGLVGDDELTTAPTLSYASDPDMNTAGTYTIKASDAAADNELYTLAYEDGTLTVSRRSSGGGGGSSSGSTGNVTGSGDDVNIDVSGGTVTAAQMERAVDRADRGETITIEASGRSSVSLPSSGLQDAADNNNDVTVELKNGEVTLSPEALSAVAEQAGTTVTLTVDPVDTDDLNSRQQAAVGDAPVFDLTIKSGGKTITDFDGGLVTVAIPYELPDGQDPAGVVVWFMDNDGNITPCDTMYDLRTETVIFTTRHFSKYVIGYEEPMNFTDVPADAYYADAVKWAVAEGITKGTSDTTFGPDVSCTRAQMVTFLWRAAGSPKATGSNPFTDVQAGSYYYDAVLWAVEQGITSGTSATTFAPDDTVTRAQTVTFLWRQAGAPVVNYAMSFTDVDANAYYGEAVRWAVSEGITSGTSDSTFSPDMDCTRAQIVTFLYRDAQ